MKKAFFNWSTGKDSALALYKILQDKNYSIDKLVTSVNENFSRVLMHGVQEELLNQQAESIGLPLEKIYFPEEVSMEFYGEIMKNKMLQLASEGFEFSVFGDIFLEDLKNYRESKLQEVNLKAVFPLWKRDSKELMKEFISVGFKAITVSISEKHLDKSFVGRELDIDFINDLPENVDACGENGEFHTFVYDGPIFKKPIEFFIGEKTKRNYTKEEKTNWDTSFWYIDLIPKNIR